MPTDSRSLIIFASQPYTELGVPIIVYLDPGVTTVGFMVEKDSRLSTMNSSEFPVRDDFRGKPLAIIESDTLWWVEWW